MEAFAERGQVNLWVNARLATMAGDRPYGTAEDACLAASQGRIIYAGPTRELPQDIERAAANTVDLNNAWVTPGLIDCHTHLVYVGNRAVEFEMRLKGATYEEIARQGGGILSTVRATRGASAEELFRQSAVRLRSLMAEGVTTVEIKSGYGLDLETEIRQLETARRLGEEFPVTVVPTYLGAHALPPEYKGRADAYIDFVCREVLPEIARRGLAKAVDAFLETIGFTSAQTERVFRAARDHGLPVKLHAEQLSDQGGARLAARHRALSADHLEHLSEDGIRAIAEAGLVAVLLPGAFYFLKDTKLPPIEALRRAGVPLAVSTDSNPGTSPAGSLLLMLNLAATLFGLTPEETLAGVTKNAARALGLAEEIGTLEAGKQADFAVWGIDHPAELTYNLGLNPLREAYKGGVRGGPFK